MEKKSPTIHIALLGTIEIHKDGVPLHFPFIKPKLLCAYLIAERRPHYRNHLAALLWPGQSEYHSRQSLRQALATIKRIFGEAFNELFLPEKETLEFIGFDKCEIDIERLRFWSQTGQEDTIPMRHKEDIDSVSGIYRGHFCQGIYLARNSAFNAWLDDRREEFLSMYSFLSRSQTTAHMR